MFPKQYQHPIFLAEHGSWNRSKKVGYQVVMITLKHQRAVSLTPFLWGFKQGEHVLGRPVDVLVMPDGALLVSDDKSGTIFRVSYK